MAREFAERGGKVALANGKLRPLGISGVLAFSPYSPGARRAGLLPLKTRSFLDYCVPRLRAALADLLPADAAVLIGDLSSS
jgi:hypothetical protein